MNLNICYVVILAALFYSCNGKNENVNIEEEIPKCDTIKRIDYGGSGLSTEGYIDNEIILIKITEKCNNKIGEFKLQMQLFC